MGGTLAKSRCHDEAKCPNARCLALYKPPRGAYKVPGLIRLFVLIAVVIWLVVSAVAWWLSGFDPGVTGENRMSDFIRRFLRCAITAVFVAILFGLAPLRYGSIPVLMVVPILLGFIWCGCLAECWSRSFGGLLFSEGDSAQFDPKKRMREMECVAVLLRAGKKDEALRLSKKLMKSGNADVMALETLFAHAGIPWKLPARFDPLIEASRSRDRGDFAAAEAFLNSVPVREPAGVHARLILVRLYAHDLKQPDKAQAVLHQLEKQPHVPAWQIEYARHAILNGGPATPPPLPVVLPESIDELLAQCYSGTAIEILGQQIAEKPGDFELRLKLLEAHAVYLGNPGSARKLLSRMENDKLFTPAQIEMARTSLERWRQPKPPGK